MNQAHSHGIGWVLAGVGIIAMVSAILSVPVWQQNRYFALMRIQVELHKERQALAGEVLAWEFENRSLSSLQRIEPVAKSLGLGFYAVPIKVMEIPAKEVE